MEQYLHFQINHEKGMSLVVVLLISSLTVAWALFLMTQALLQSKMQNAYYENSKKIYYNEANLLSKENEFYKNSTLNEDWIQFVPENLIYDQRKGIRYYLLKSNEIETIQAKRIFEESKIPLFSFRYQLDQWGAIRLFNNNKTAYLALQIGDHFKLIDLSIYFSDLNPIIVLIDSKSKGNADKLAIGTKNGDIFILDLELCNENKCELTHWAKLEGEVKAILPGIGHFEHQLNLVVQSLFENKSMIASLFDSEIYWTKEVHDLESIDLKHHWIICQLLNQRETVFYDRYTGEICSPSVIETILNRQSWYRNY